uniref:chitinase n=1 Tax=Hirsutella thompsonii TaxID=42368 RepID=A0A097F8K4_HIRTH|nr:chitinase [Hirsutella thompsonii]
MRLFQTALFALLATEAVAESVGQAIASGDSPNYHCKKDKPCALGCCGPLASAGSANKRIIGYYEGWNYQRSCDTMKPSEIPLGYYTHINYAFALIHPTQFTIDAMDDKTGSLYRQVTELKNKDPGLKVWIAIGGWAFNDPGPTQSTFSLVAKVPAARELFFNSLITFMINNGFDGVDLDWEYPAANDRGGKPEDFKNLVAFIAKLRSRLDASGKDFGLSITLPSSYWYMQHFDVIALEPHVDWFNMMTYDIHGTWDGAIPSLGPRVQAHTNLTEIELAMELLWRNNINPERVTMGLGFYGRSFTLKDPSCTAPGCPFSGPGKPGECTGTGGVLSAGEINRAIKNGGKMTLDEPSAAQIVTFGGDQWVSFDDSKSLGLKQKWANEHCIGGLMVWAIDLDDGSLLDALFRNTGRKKRKTRDPTENDYNVKCFEGGINGGR